MPNNISKKANVIWPQSIPDTKNHEGDVMPRESGLIDYRSSMPELWKLA